MSSYDFSVDLASCASKHCCITSCVLERKARASSSRSDVDDGRAGADHDPNVIDSSASSPSRLLLACLELAGGAVVAEDDGASPLPAGRPKVTLAHGSHELKLMPHHLRAHNHATRDTNLNTLAGTCHVRIARSLPLEKGEAMRTTDDYEVRASRVP